jgi:hypothetical protein
MAYRSYRVGCAQISRLMYSDGDGSQAVEPEAVEQPEPEEPAQNAAAAEWEHRIAQELEVSAAPAWCKYSCSIGVATIGTLLHQTGTHTNTEAGRQAGRQGRQDLDRSIQPLGDLHTQTHEIQYSCTPAGAATCWCGAGESGSGSCAGTQLKGYAIPYTTLCVTYPFVDTPKLATAAYTPPSTARHRDTGYLTGSVVYIHSPLPPSPPCKARHIHNIECVSHREGGAPSGPPCTIVCLWNCGSIRPSNYMYITYHIVHELYAQIA